MIAPLKTLIQMAKYLILFFIYFPPTYFLFTIIFVCFFSHNQTED